MDEPTYRINKITSAMMLTVAIFFDLAQMASKIFYFLGLAVVGAAIGAAVSDTFGVSAETGAAVGGVVGAALQLVPIVGQTAAVATGTVISEIISWSITIVGYFTLWIWFLMKGVPILGGKKMEAKFTMFFVSLIIEMVPLLNGIPTITLWTWRMIILSRWEDKEGKGVKMSEWTRQSFLRKKRGARRLAGTDSGDTNQYEEGYVA